MMYLHVAWWWNIFTQAVVKYVRMHCLVMKYIHAAYIVYMSTQHVYDYEIRPRSLYRIMKYVHAACIRLWNTSTQPV